MARHTPPNALDVQFSIQLEYLQCDYLLNSPMKIPAAEYPKFNEISDNNFDINNKVYEFKRRFSPTSGHAFRIALYNAWEGNYGAIKADEFLYNLGSRGYLNLFSPYLLRDSDVDFGDFRLKIGVALAEGEMGEFDFIEFNGGYSGTISYFKDYEAKPLVSRCTSQPIGRDTERVCNGRENRVALYISNPGTTRIYIAFGDFSVSFFNPIIPGTTPFIEPGQTASFEFGKVIGFQDAGFWSAKNYQFFLQSSVWAVREGAASPVVTHELYFN